MLVAAAGMPRRVLLRGGRRYRIRIRWTGWRVADASRALDAIARDVELLQVLELGPDRVRFVATFTPPTDGVADLEPRQLGGGRVELVELVELLDAPSS